MHKCDRCQEMKADTATVRPTDGVDYGYWNGKVLCASCRQYRRSIFKQINRS